MALFSCPKQGGDRMSDNFGLKIGVEGEKEFKKTLAGINQNLFGFLQYEILTKV